MTFGLRDLLWGTALAATSLVFAYCWIRERMFEAMYKEVIRLGRQRIESQDARIKELESQLSQRSE
jgi:hypothetical protein